MKFEITQHSKYMCNLKKNASKETLLYVYIYVKLYNVTQPPYHAHCHVI